MGWSLLWPFLDLLCSPNYVNMPINFLLRGLFFQAWGSLTSLKSQTRDPQIEVPPGGLVLRIFTSWKNPSTSAGFEPANLKSRSKHVTPRPPRPTYKVLNKIDLNLNPRRLFYGYLNRNSVGKICSYRPRVIAILSLFHQSTRGKFA